MLKTSKGTDKFGFAKNGKRHFAGNLYARKDGATTDQVKSATLKKFGKGYPMLNMLKKLDATNKNFKVATDKTTNNKTGRTVTVYRIVKR